MKEQSKYAAASLLPGQVPEDPNESYPLVQNLIFDQVWKFHRRYGGDVDELTGEANMAFVKGHEQFIKGVRPSGEPLTTTYAVEIRRWVWYEMFDKMRTRVHRHTVAPFSSLDEMEYDIADSRRGWDATAWADELTEDGYYAASLVLAPNEEVVAVSQAKGGTPRNYRSTVRQYLANQGWDNNRINVAFEDIRRVLG